MKVCAGEEIAVAAQNRKTIPRASGLILRVFISTLLDVAVQHGAATFSYGLPNCSAPSLWLRMAARCTVFMTRVEPYCTFSDTVVVCAVLPEVPVIATV